MFYYGGTNIYASPQTLELPLNANITKSSTLILAMFLRIRAKQQCSLIYQLLTWKITPDCRECYSAFRAKCIKWRDSACGCLRLYESSCRNS